MKELLQHKVPFPQLQYGNPGQNYITGKKNYITIPKMKAKFSVPIPQEALLVMEILVTNIHTWSTYLLSILLRNHTWELHWYADNDDNDKEDNSNDANPDTL